MSRVSKKVLVAVLLAALTTASLSTEQYSTEFEGQKILEKTTKENEQSNVANAYRLPKSVRPVTYDIKLSDINFTKFTFKGIAVINVRTLEETNKILLHAGNLTILLMAVNVEQNGMSKNIFETFYKNATTEIITIELKENVRPLVNISISTMYNGVLRDDMIGFYKSSYIDELGNERWLAATQFESTHARHAFPCFDEPDLKANFTISISQPNDNFKCLSNMPFKVQNEWYIFEESVSMSTYLVAFVISDFESWPNDTANFRVWSRPNTLKQAQYGLGIGEKALDYFEKLLGEPYPLKKMDMVAVPDFSAGAMENWGLITYRESAMLFDEVDSSAAAKQRVASVIVHECTHMWFGNLVTPAWWSFLWLSEAFARYYQYMATDKIEPNWKMDQQFVVEQHQAALGIDASEDSKPMTRLAVTQLEIGGMGDSITYSKGASIVRMMEQTFGSGIFNSALQKYIKNRKYKSATPDNLWEALQEQVNAAKDPKLNISVATVMKKWTEQAGFPYITVNIKSDVITLSQDRFFILKSNAIPEESVWSVPITWMTSNEVNKSATPSTKPVYWLSDRNINLPNENKDAEWMIFNVNSAGFYRVNYDGDSWNKIIKVLNSDDFEKIPELNRAAIVDDLLNLARAGTLNYEVALRGIQYLRRETNYLPFKSAFTSLDYLIRKFSTSSDKDLFKEFVISLFENIYQNLTFTDKTNDDQLKILLRQEINNRACNLEYPQCISESKRYFADWMTSQKPIPKNQRSTAYCTAIKYGTEKEWNYLMNQYRTANVAAEQITILQALGCSAREELLEKYLLSALKGFNESLIRKQDISTVFSSVYSFNVKGAEFMIQFVQKHYDAITKYYNGTDEIANLISGALLNYPTQSLINEVEKLIKNENNQIDLRSIKSIKSALKKSVQSAKLELEWFKTHSPSIINLLRIYKYPNENTTDYRLPENVTPSAYTIHLTPFLEGNKLTSRFTFNGTVKIIAEVTKITDKIVLHADQLQEIKVKVQKLNSNGNELIDLPVLNFTSTEKYHFLNIYMKSPISPKTNISIEITYKGFLNTEMRGFYRSSYKINNTTRWLAATHLEPVGARRVFPCFDEPALKATFNISVEVEENYKAISNTKLKSKTNRLYEFERTPVMSTYLVAIVVSDFNQQTQKDEEHANKREYSVWANPLVIHQANYSLEVMRPIIEFFEKKLGHLYTLPKMDMVALPDFSSGAMENWGLITYRETMMLYDPAAMSTLANKQTIRNVIAHEIAHQWFGNLVSPQWWDYLWLSEGFARYFQYYAHTEAEASWNLENQFVVDHLQTSFTDDASTSTHPVTAKVYSPSEIRGIFDKISYAKAGSIIRMLEKLIGSEKFYDALHRYLAACQNSTGTPETLFEAFENELKSEKSITFNITKVMNSWTREAGFPVVNVTIKENVATITQQRFYLRPPENETKKPAWIVPISWTTQSTPNFNNTDKVEWLEGTKPLSINIDKANADWVIFNLQQTGYYRVNYDEASWLRIIMALNSDQRELIHEVNRASLIDDMLNLGRTGLLDYDLVLAGTRYLAHETEYVPWKAAFNGLSYLNKQFVNRTEIFGAYKDYLFEILEPSFKRLKFDEVQGEKHTDTLLRKLVLEWLCYFGHSECTIKAFSLFKKQRTDPSYSIPPSKRSFVYCTAIKKGSNKDWEYLWKKFEESNYATEQMTILSALGCSLNPSNLKRLLDSAITPESGIRLQDADKAFKSVIGGSTVGLETVLDYLNENYDRIQKYFNDNAVIKSCMSSIAKKLPTEALTKKFDLVMKNLSDKIPSIAKALQSSQKRVNIELTWYKTRSPKISDWLSRNKSKSSHRLITFAKPEAYDIYIRPYFEEHNFTFDGNVTIDIKIDEETRDLGLHAKYLNIEDIKAENNNILDWKLDAAVEKLNIQFVHKLTAGTKLKLHIRYNGYLRNDMRGFYRSYYINDEGKKVWLASTQFEPTFARSAFPCFDEPLFKATFTMHIAKPKGYHTLSNMGSSPEQRIDSNGVAWDHYKPSLKMSPYIVAFIVSDFSKYVGSIKPPRVSVWARSQLKDYVTHASDIGSKSLELLENYTQINYPLDEMNFVSVPDFDMGAMENWGLVTYREYGLTYNESSISASYKQYVVTTIAHELVHMWFGNLVTCEWWDYAWLNEGFAEYISYVISDSIEPSWKLLNQFVVENLQIALGIDSSGSSQPMNHKVNTSTEAKDAFDKITYAKASSVLRMFDHSLGKQVFVEAVRNYLKNRQYDTARPEHLITAIKERLDKDKISVPGNLEISIETAMESWTTQSGYPVVNATRKGQEVVLSQERFLLSPANFTEKLRTYWTPITYITESELNFGGSTTPRLWLGEKPKTISVQSNDTWFILNPQVLGFYRVNYDEATWITLVGLLNSERYTAIDEVNRAQLIHDALNLARAGYVDHDIALNATKYLAKESSHLPWRSYFDALSYLAQRIEGREDIKQFFSRYILSLVSNRYQKLGFKEDMKNDEHLDQLNRQLILTWACNYGHTGCVKESKDYFRQKSVTPVTPNIASTVYCTAITYGTSEDWYSLWDEYTKAILATDYLTMLKGLGCSRNVTILEWYMNQIIEKDSKVRRQDVATAFSSVYTSSQVGLQIALNYFSKNLDKLFDYYGDWMDVGSLFTNLASRISTVELIKQLEGLKENNNINVINIESSLKSAVSTAKKNLEWFDKYSEKIYAWLKVNYNSTENPEQPGESENKPGSATIPISLSFILLLISLILSCAVC